LVSLAKGGETGRMAISALPFQHLQCWNIHWYCPLKKIDGAKLKPAFGCFFNNGNLYYN
jgi:hypothetical protein